MVIRCILDVLLCSSGIIYITLDDFQCFSCTSLISFSGVPLLKNALHIPPCNMLYKFSFEVFEDFQIVFIDFSAVCLIIN